jgi:hypothetical protein
MRRPTSDALARSLLDYFSTQRSRLMTQPVLKDDSFATARTIEQGVLLHVGEEVYPVYGSDQLGWTLDSGDLHARVASRFRYQSLAELFFVIVNFSISSHGRA